MSKLDSDKPRTQRDPSNEQSKSHLIVKIKSRVRVKTISHLRVKRTPSRIRVKETPSHERDQMQGRTLQEFSSNSSRDLINNSSLTDECISTEENALEKEHISEILALLEHARSRSRNHVENDVILEHTSKPNDIKTKRRRPDNYY
ncbi:MAG: hypothetical protein ACXADH_17700 [Candidatus Kariarchaeaceae archaeon]|jgi:hypothetical protein